MNVPGSRGKVYMGKKSNIYRSEKKNLDSLLWGIMMKYPVQIPCN